MFAFLVLCKKQYSTSDNEYALHFHVHEMGGIVDFRESHVTPPGHYNNVLMTLMSIYR